MLIIDNYKVYVLQPLTNCHKFVVKITRLYIPGVEGGGTEKKTCTPASTRMVHNCTRGCRRIRVHDYKRVRLKG